MLKDDTFVIDPQSSYYLHPSDGPVAIITSTKFDRKNYGLWNRALTMALMSKNKLGFIDGSISKPATTVTPAMKNAWNMVNSIITSWILDVIDSKLHTSVAYEDMAHKVWVNIQKR